MKKKLIKKVKHVLFWFLNLLGFTAFMGCKDVPIEPQVCMYGCPENTYLVSDGVNEAQNTENINNIEVIEKK